MTIRGSLYPLLRAVVLDARRVKLDASGFVRSSSNGKLPSLASEAAIVERY